MTAPLGIDPEGVERWFRDNVDDVTPPLEFLLIPGGHSCLTYTVDTGDGRRFVLRRPPAGHTLATAHDVLREHRIITALADTDVPVAPVVGACSDAEVTGAPFYVMEFVDGIVLHDRAAAETLTPAPRAGAAQSMIDVLVALQRVDPDEVGLGDFAKRTDYLGRQLKRWSSQWAASVKAPLAGMDRLYEWLVANRPDEGRTCVVHGDFRLGNVIHDRDTGAVAALLDWELSTLGPALADLSYLLRSWVEPREAASVARPPASTADGFPTRGVLIERYEQASGQGTADLSYWLAFHAWRSACITAGVYTRYVTGVMGDRLPENVEVFGQAVDEGMAAGLAAAGLA